MISVCLSRASRLPYSSSSFFRLAASSSSSRTLVSATLSQRQQELPYHLLMGLPALSPTMETGALAEWYVKEGDKFIAGDAIAKIETDKASIDFEAQDDAFVAKILVAAGDGTDIKVGTPILICVEDEGDVAAFADYVLPDQPVAAAAAVAVEAAVPAAVSAASAPEPEVAAAPAATPQPPVQVAVAAPTPAPLPAAAAATATVASVSAPRPSSVRPSALTKTLSKSQQAYLASYGTTGQVPL